MYLPDSVRLDDAVHGAEFSVRVDGVLSRNNIVTVGDLRAKRDQLPRLKGLGRQSLYEINVWLDSVSQVQGTLPLNTEHERYRLEDAVNSAESILHDVLRALTRTALKGKVTKETRKHMRLKLEDACKYIDRLPTYGDDE